MWRRWHIPVLAVALLAVVVSTGLVAYRHWSPLSTDLVLGDGGGAICWAASSPADVATRSEVGTTIGVDVLRLSDDGGVAVDQVALSHPVGGLELMSAAFVPGAFVGAGFSAAHGIVDTYPALTALARSAPTVLNPTARPAAVTDAPWDPRLWQLAVTVRAPVTSAVAGTDGFVVTYHRGTAVRTVTTHVSVQLRGVGSQCGT